MFQNRAQQQLPYQALAATALKPPTEMVFCLPVTLSDGPAPTEGLYFQWKGREETRG